VSSETLSSTAKYPVTLREIKRPDETSELITTGPVMPSRAPVRSPTRPSAGRAIKLWTGGGGRAEFCPWTLSGLNRIRVQRSRNERLMGAGLVWEQLLRWWSQA